MPYLMQDGRCFTDYRANHETNRELSNKVLNNCYKDNIKATEVKFNMGQPSPIIPPSEEEKKNL